MILITLGTQDKSFKRLLNLVNQAIQRGIIKEKVIAQTGWTNFASPNIETFAYLSQEELTNLVKKASFVITHGGVGSIIMCLKEKKKVVAMARQKKYKEHTNDHQNELLDAFSEDGFIIKTDENNFFASLEKVKTFTPKEYKFNNDCIIQKITEYIDNKN